MTENPAVPQDLKDRGYALVSEPPHTVETTLLGAAWRALVAEVPTVAARLDAGQIDRDLVIDVICAATKRVLDNPEGDERLDVQIDDYREGRTLRKSPDDIYFSARELARLTPVTYGAGSVQYS